MMMRAGLTISLLMTMTDIFIYRQF
ncbi:unnamed protein product [Allacma fusca]|uniref:Uncharacterized protein n=1 Tax=Allacma fusca TaxID=39272 RepID=A0A8J2PBT9_9HEXA|nr:unnamed protein product [Allacma fusca]